MLTAVMLANIVEARPCLELKGALLFCFYNLHSCEKEGILRCLLLCTILSNVEQWWIAKIYCDSVWYTHVVGLCSKRLWTQNQKNYYYESRIRRTRPFWPYPTKFRTCSAKTHDSGYHMSCNRMKGIEPHCHWSRIKCIEPHWPHLTSSGYVPHLPEVVHYITNQILHRLSACYLTTD